MVYFMFDLVNLAIVIVGCFMGGFLPLMILIAKCPEAKEFIKCMVSGGVMIDKINAAGQREYVCAKPYGNEGQYIAGRNEFGQRQIFVRPQTADSSFGKANMLVGIRRPIFSAFTGKTVMVPASVLAAIAAAELSTEDKEKLPSNVKRWMDENKVTLEEIQENISTVKVEPTADNPSGSVQVKTKNPKNSILKILDLDATKIATYFRGWYNQSQFDVLLQKSEQNGYLRGVGVRNAGGGGKNKWLFVGIIIFIVITIVGIVGFFLLGGR